MGSERHLKPPFPLPSPSVPPAPPPSLTSFPLSQDPAAAGKHHRSTRCAVRFQPPIAANGGEGKLAEETTMIATVRRSPFAVSPAAEVAGASPNVAPEPPAAAVSPLPR
jgi:hypothetical protein